MPTWNAAGRLHVTRIQEKHVDGTEQGPRWVWMGAQWEAVEWPEYGRSPHEVLNGAAVKL